MSDVDHTKREQRNTGFDDEEAGRPMSEQMGEIWSWTRAALRRRRLLVVSLFLVVGGAAAAAVWFMPRTYTAHGSVLAQSNIHLPMLANPRRAIPHTADNPIRSVAPLVMSERNLERLVEETDLLRIWEERRSPASRLKDRVFERFAEPIGSAEKRDVLVELLRERVIVYADDEVVNFLVTWYDPETPVLLVRNLQEILLEERRLREQGVISDALEILERHRGEARDEVERRFSMLRELREERDRSSPRPTRQYLERQLEREQTRSRAARARAAQLRDELEDLQRSYREMEGVRQRRLAEARYTLRQRSLDLGPAHPDLRALEREVEALRSPPEEMDGLRERIVTVQGEFVRSGGLADALAEAPGGIAHQRMTRILRELEESVSEEDEEISQGRAQLGIAVGDYEDIRARMGAARIELDTADAAFKYRYTVIGEPRPPRDANGPPTTVMLAGVVFLGLMLGVVAGVGREALNGAILKSWQMERMGLPVFGELEAWRRR